MGETLTPQHDGQLPGRFQNLEFAFQLDACATAETALCSTAYFDDSLSRHWLNPTFCNPPYGRRIGDWVEKAYRESMLGNTCVLLLPSRTDTSWWHDYCMKASEIRLLRGRLYFDDNRQKRAPFPSAIVV
jgi:hypothetical protein